jgi:osmotically-inducible protein OsmY
VPTDSDLQYAVLAEFNWEPSVNGAHIGVAAQRGVVTLTGHVSTFAEKHAAEAAARRVKGVIAVAEEIEVRLPFDTQRDDEDIAAAAVDRIDWDATVPSDAVKVQVEAGWVTLTGDVDWHYQKEAAEQDIRPLLGVVGLSNKIVIRPRVDTQNLSENVVHALHRSWFFDPHTITVTSDRGRVRLSGSVHTPHERQVAAATAWAAPGTISVQNDIAII